MRRNIDVELRARAVRLVADYSGQYPNQTAIRFLFWSAPGFWTRVKLRVRWRSALPSAPTVSVLVGGGDAEYWAWEVGNLGAKLHVSGWLEEFGGLPDADHSEVCGRGPDI